MTDPHDADNRMQTLLAELRQAEQAKVFEPTPVSAGQLVGQRRRVSSRSRARRVLIGLQAAACIALVVGVANWWRPGQTSSILGGAEAGRQSQATGGQAVSVLAGCLAGPTGSGALGGCGRVDYDTDGDVDLVDFGAYQRLSRTGR
ncbi:MAG: hypothetical protein ACE5GE_11540 [Phycisphaerae bacterium]